MSEAQTGVSPRDQDDVQELTDPDDQTPSPAGTGSPPGPSCVSRANLDARLVMLALAGCAGLSIWGLGRQSIWIDEAASLGATNQLKATLLGTAGTMGSYYALLDVWTEVVGSSASALRGLSVVFALGVVLACAAVFRRVLEAPAAILAVGVLAASPGLVRYAQEARSYALVILLSSIAWLCVINAVKAEAQAWCARARGWWGTLAVVSVVGVAAHGLFPLQLAAMVVSLLVLPNRQRLLRSASPAVISSVTTVALLSQLGAGQIADWVPPLELEQLRDLVHELLAPEAAAAVVLGLFALIGATHLVRSAPADPFARWLALIPIAWASLPTLGLAVISVIRPYLIPRYVIASTPAIAMLIAVGVIATARAIAREAPGRRRVVTALVALPLVLALTAGQLRLHDRQGYDWRSAAELVAQSARPGDAVLMTAPSLRMAFEAAWRDADPTITPSVIWTPRAFGEVRRFDQRSSLAGVRSEVSQVRRIWLVHQTTVGSGDGARAAMLDFLPVRKRFVIAQDVRFEGGVEVLLLARR